MENKPCLWNKVPLYFRDDSFTALYKPNISMSLVLPNVFINLQVIQVKVSVFHSLKSKSKCVQRLRTWERENKNKRFREPPDLSHMSGSDQTGIDASGSKRPF